MEVKAILNRTRTAPQKARLVARLIYGKNVNDAMNILQLTRKKAARIIQKVLKSALANIVNIGSDKKILLIVALVLYLLYKMMGG